MQDFNDCFWNTDSAAPCCKLLQWVRLEQDYQVHLLHFWSHIFYDIAVKSVILFLSAVVASVNSSSRPSEVNNSAVIGKLCTSIKA